MRMKIVMNSILAALLAMSSNSAWAFLGFGGTQIQQVVTCVGLDGVPLTGSLATNCCRDGHLISNAPASCRAGFNTISSDTMSGAVSSITLAQQTLNVAHDLNGTSTDINHVEAPQSGTQTSANNNVNSTKSAMLSGGDTMSNDPRFGSGSASAGSGSGVGGGAMGSGAMGSGSGLGGGSGGFGNNGSGANGAGKDPNGDANKPIGGGFASNGGGGKDGGFGSADISFGGAGGNGSGDLNGEGLDGIGFDDEALTADGANGDVEGTMTDPSNYFSLTNKSDDIFKIVSRRYTKKFHKLAGRPSKRIPAGKLPNNKPL